VFVVTMPVLVVLGLAVLDLMHDYARMELVVARKPVMESFLSGLAWPFRYGRSLLIYAGWFLVSVVLLGIATIIDFRPGGLWGVFLLQQVFLFLRAGSTIAWFGSEVDYYEGVATERLPLLADSAPLTVSAPTSGSAAGSPSPDAAV
jgi:hypothetical protein